MKKSGIVIFGMLFLGLVCSKPGCSQSSTSAATAAGSQSSSPASALENDKEKISYALGMRLSTEVKRLQRMEVDLDPSLVAQGLKDALSGGKPMLSDEEKSLALAQLQQGLIFKEKQKKQEEALANLKEGQAFLEANKAKEGVVALPSGLQYKILQQGTGPKPAVNDSVICNYKGTLINGQEFDSSYKRGGPSTFRVMGVIRGWSEALQLMPVGSKWQLFIPPSLAYEDQGSGKDIPPNATLIFEVELLSIKDKETPPAK
jgi:FKBP-type peptidyl-prolyl cis-trans isomerase FklB